MSKKSDKNYWPPSQLRAYENKVAILDRVFYALFETTIDLVFTTPSIHNLHPEYRELTVSLVTSLHAIAIAITAAPRP